jgi:hypothetical protein
MTTGYERQLTSNIQVLDNKLDSLVYKMSSIAQDFGVGSGRKMVYQIELLQKQISELAKEFNSKLNNVYANKLGNLERVVDSIKSELRDIKISVTHHR